MPCLMLEIKASIDRQRVPGKFLLTGSADIFKLPNNPDSLIGRLSKLTLWPLSQSEIEGKMANLAQMLFDGTPETFSTGGEEEIWSRIERGGMPEAVEMTERGRARWYNDYANDLIMRDLRDISNVGNTGALTRLLRYWAAFSSSELNLSNISRELGLPNTTLRDYYHLFVLLFTLVEVPAWDEPIGKDVMKRPKTFLMDTGLAMALARVKRVALERDKPEERGRLLETFLHGEIRKHAEAGEDPMAIHHYREAKGTLEVDFLLEDTDGRLIAIECKSAPRIGFADYQNLVRFRQKFPTRVHRSFLFYLGNEIKKLTEETWAIPMSYWWQN